MLDAPPQLLPFHKPGSSSNSPTFPGAKKGSPLNYKQPAPKNLNEFLAKIDEAIPESLRKGIKSISEAYVCDCCDVYHLLDFYIGGLYSRWDTGKIREYFSKRGVKDTWAVRDILIHSYWRRVNGRPLRLGQQIGRQIEIRYQMDHLKIIGPTNPAQSQEP